MAEITVSRDQVGGKPVAMNGIHSAVIEPGREQEQGYIGFLAEFQAMRAKID